MCGCVRCVFGRYLLLLFRPFRPLPAVNKVRHRNWSLAMMARPPYAFDDWHKWISVQFSECSIWFVRTCWSQLCSLMQKREIDWAEKRSCANKLLCSQLWFSSSHLQHVSLGLKSILNSKMENVPERRHQQRPKMVNVFSYSWKIESKNVWPNVDDGNATASDLYATAKLKYGQIGCFGLNRKMWQ